MRHIALAVLAAAIALSGAGLGTAANAMNVCGINGCAPVLVKRVRVPPRMVTTRAAPLVVSNTPAPAAAAPALPSLPSLPSLPLLASAPWPLSLLGK